MSNTSAAAVPNHLGIILDGNRRWAKSQGLPAVEGHRQGVETLKEITRAAFNHGVKYLTAYVFSTENWKRAKDEVSFLMSLVIRVLDRDLEQLHQDGIKIVILGSRLGLSQKVINAIEKAEKRTADNQKGVLALCLNYGGRQEIVDGVKQILQARVDHIELTEELVTQHLYHPEVPDIDLLIRTSGEQRLSNFMLWRAAYAELYFTDKYWPAFTPADLDVALADYAARHRRFGS